jgi:hypothetical protein
MADRSDPISDLPAEFGGFLTQLNYGTGPFVAKNQRELFGPHSREITVDDMRVRSANGYGFHPAKDFHLSRYGNRNVAIFQVVYTIQSYGFHCLFLHNLFSLFFIKFIDP